MEHWYNETDAKTEVLREENHSGATWSTTKPTTGVGLNLGLCS